LPFFVDIFLHFRVYTYLPAYYNQTKHMKKITTLIAAVGLLLSCNTVPSEKTNGTQTALPVEGTWKLISGTLVDNVKGDTVVTDYTNGKSFIKILNGTHFAFLNHDLSKGKGKDADFSAGGGHYTLVGDQYTEILEYCNDREWENHDFHFTLTIKNDTFVQKGIEKIDSIGVNRLNIEKYVRVK